MSRSPQLPPKGGTITIIGAGATGALCAEFLTAAGFQVIILEKATPGNGSSSRSAAAIRAQFSTPDTVAGMMWAEYWFTKFYDELGVPEADRGEAVIVQNGYLWLFEDPEAVPSWNTSGRAELQTSWDRARKDVVMQQKVGLSVEILTPDEITARWPHLSEEAWRLIGGIFCGTDGFLRHDLVYQVGLQQARAHGATLMVNTEVIGCETKEDGKIVALRVLRDGSYQVIPCDAVVNATNAWAPRLSAMLGGAPLPIKPTRRYLTVQGRPPNGISDDAWRGLPFTIYGKSKGRECYSRPEGPGQLMLGWATTPSRSTDSRTRIRIALIPDSATTIGPRLLRTHWQCSSRSGPSRPSLSPAT